MVDSSEPLGSDRGTLTAGGDVTVRIESPAEAEQERYEIIDEIARGGMGRVLSGTDRRLGRPVAIKEILPGAQVLKNRFEREVQITARLQHPSILPVYDSGTWASGLPFYVMRLVSGRPLSEAIAEAKTIDARLALLPNFLAAADAIAFAHEQRIVHRDIKPSNILVGTHGETVVIDWGIAKQLTTDVAGPDAPTTDDILLHDPADGETIAGSVLGTPGYMAPEQAQGFPADPRSDVYALGASLYEGFCGEPPPAHALRQPQPSRPVEPIRTRVPAVPLDLSAIIDKALAFDPEDRYPDAAGLAADLRRFLTGQLVAAHHYSLSQRIARFVRAHKGAVTIAIAAVVILAAVLGFSIDSITSERNDALAARHDALVARANQAWRADQMLLHRAASFASSSPTTAAALLKELPPESEQWPKARSIFLEAAMRGIATRLEGPSGIALMAWHPHTGALVVVGDSEVVVHRFEGATSSADEIGRIDARAVDAALIDGGTAVAVVSDRPRIEILALDKSGRRRIDIPEGARQVIAAGMPEELYWLSNSGAVYRTSLADGTSARVGPDKGATELLVPAAAPFWVTAGKGGVQVWDRQGKARTLAPEGSRLVLSTDGKRLAFVSSMQDVEEFEIDESGVARVATWQVAGVINLVFGFGGRLMASDDDGGVFGLWREKSPVLLHRSSDRAYLYPGHKGAAIAVNGGATILRPVRRDFRVPEGSEGSTRVAYGSRRIAVANNSNEIFVWDLEPVLPQQVSIGKAHSVIMLTADAALVHEKDSGAWVRLDLGTGERKRLTPQLDYYGDDIVFRYQDLIVTGIPPARQVVRLSDGKMDRRKFAAEVALAVDDHTLLYSVGRTLRKRVLFDDDAGPTLVRTFEQRILYMNANDAGGVYITTEGGHLFHAPGGDSEASVALPGKLTAWPFISPTGTLFVGVDNKVYGWKGTGTLKLVATLPTEISRVEPYGDSGFIAVSDRGLYLVEEGGTISDLAMPKRWRAPSFFGSHLGVGGSSGGNLLLVDLKGMHAWEVPSIPQIRISRAPNTNVFAAHTIDGDLHIYDFDRNFPETHEALRALIEASTPATIGSDLKMTKWPSASDSVVD